MHLDPSCNTKNMTEEMKQELLEDLFDMRREKEILVRPNNRSAAKAADTRVKNLANEVSIPEVWSSEHSTHLSSYEGWITSAAPTICHLSRADTLTTRSNQP